MAIFKCKMCGGTLEINNETVAVCEYCGTEQTLPKLDDDRRANLYDRANHFRRNNEFDKAMGIYEQILNEDNTDAEAYWSLVLCRYGIEYVEDPTSHKRVPTVNRAQFTSVFDDEDYKSALQYADSFQKKLYEQEAAAINDIQKGILAISQNEEPFDIFICYKETDNNGRRTPDSVLATELYHELTREGYKVFFSRITLEDKLGSAYEPYIFAALNSAKVMVVLGTKPEYFNAVWVKNEWSRFLALIKNGARKMLIPAYKDMDPYDLPDEFSHLQAQDMSKLGFMQDLIRGIKKIIGASEPKATVVKETVVTAANVNTAPLLKRAFMFLEDADFNSANEYCEKVLDLDPECAMAYLGKLMAELRVKTREGLKNCDKLFDNRNNFQKAVRFADENLKKELQGYIDFIINRNLTAAYNDAVKMMNDAVFASQCEDAATKFEALKDFKDSKELVKKCFEKRHEILYNDAIYAMDAAESEEDYKNVAADFEALQDYKDSNELAKECYDKAEEARLLALYNGALSAMNAASSEETYHIAAALFDRLAEYKDSSALANECREKAEGARKDAIYNRAISRVKGILFIKTEEHTLELACGEFKAISGWRDADEQLECCLKKIEQIKIEQKQAELEAERIRIEKAAKAKKTKIIAIITTSIVCIVIAFVIVLNSVIIPNNKYNEAVALCNNKDYKNAISAFLEIEDYKDSKDYIIGCAIMSGLRVKDYIGDAEEIIIPDIVTSIGNNAFEGCESLTSITIPNGVTSIGNCAFRYCDSLTSITIPNSVTSIGNYAFDNCSSLTSITIPDSVTSIGEYAFQGCTELTSVTIGNSVTSIGDDAFSGCSSLTSITIPDGVTSIGDYTFLNCTSLENITIPNSVTSIGEYAFSYCRSLTSITIPDSVTSIGEHAFHGCTGLTSVTIGNSVTSIGDWAFQFCESLTSITIPNSVTSIGNCAFRYCDSLTSITIPNSVTSIGNYAFSDCSSLKSITIPDSVTSIGNGAFYSSRSSLKKVYFHSEAQKQKFADIFPSGAQLIVQ